VTLASENPVEFMQSGNTSELSVVIPTHRRPDALAKVLDGLSLQTLSPGRFEVIVVLDGPCAETVRLLERADYPFSLRWFEQPSRGAPAARNYGVQKASADVLVFLDDDMIPAAELLARHYECHLRDRMVVIGPFMISPDSPHPLVAEAIDWGAAHIQRCSVPGYEPTYRDLPDGNMSARKADILRAGGWDESFVGFGGDDDLELGIRLEKLGIRFHFAAGAMGYHYYTKSWLGLLRDRRHVGHAHQYFLRKHPDRIHSFWFFRTLTGSRWRRAAFWTLGHLPEFVFSFSRAVASRAEGLDSARSRAALRPLVKLSGAAFYYRGIWDGASTARSLYQQLGIKVPILGYHHVVRNATGDPELFMDLSQFERQMRTLAFLGFKTISLRDLCLWLDGQATLPRKPVILTFDDGYEGFLPVIAPVLERYNFTATIFLIAGKIGGEVVWKDRPPMRIMTAEETSELARRGFDIQSHGVIHADSRQIEPAALRSELLESKRVIERITEKPVRFFAYPYGLWSPEARETVAQTGFAAACTSRQGRNNYNEDRYLLKRSFILRDSEFWRVPRELYR
jgi:peptidoglycan/xylan/chitin deacetylase (PgdA/CDA1 family)/GT2 family glycosyltransferase